MCCSLCIYILNVVLHKFYIICSVCMTIRSNAGKERSPVYVCTYICACSHYQAFYEEMILN
jgi:hypothetical protein